MVENRTLWSKIVHFFLKMMRIFGKILTKKHIFPYHKVLILLYLALPQVPLLCFWHTYCNTK